MAWINKETELINATEVYQWFKDKHSLRESFQIWDSQKVPFLFNDHIALVLYIEKGALMISVYFYKINKWCFYPFNKIEGMDNFDFKGYSESISSAISRDELGNLDLTRKLNYYLHLIDDFLKDIIEGDFSKLKDNMELMKDSQIEGIREMMNKVKF